MSYSNKIALIFGANGQDGVYLRLLLKLHNLKVIAVSRNNSEIIGDVSNKQFVFDLIKTNRPDYIFHLAANSSVSHEFIFENFDTICRGTNNILEACRLFSSKTKIFLSGSALQFRNYGLPIDEKTDFYPNNSYSVARIESVYMARYFREKFGLNIFIGYFFNHDSSLRSERHVNQRIIHEVIKIRDGKQNKLVVGNLDVRKEFNYAGDVIEAVWLLVNQVHVNEIIIGSGKAYSIEEWIDICFQKVNLDWTKYVEVDKNFKSEYSILVSDPTILYNMGWSPKVDFITLRDKMFNNEL